jgi:hypothetical protein
MFTNRSAIPGVLVACIALAVAGCEANKSKNPLSPNVAGPIAGVVITTPKGLEPASGARVVADQQPLTLLIENPTTNGERKLVMEVEVSTTTAFDALVHKSTTVEPGANGRTSYKLPEALTAGRTYHWRVRGVDGANTGAWSNPISFDVVAPVIVETPLPLSPVLGQVLTTNAPVLIVSNGKVSGTANVSYRFEIARDAGFSAMVAVLTVPRSTASTTQVQLGTQPYSTQFFWRVSASDGAITSPYSSTHAFSTMAQPVTPPPVTQPPVTQPPVTPPPSSPGYRTPDPPSGQMLPLPNMASVVYDVARANPRALANSCQDAGGNWEFLDLVVDALRRTDTRWGYNCKRGVCPDISQDVVAYHAGAGPEVNGALETYTVDIIGGHCGPSPSAMWAPHTYSSGAGAARWHNRFRF